MKKTFIQIAQHLLNNCVSSDFDYRTILHWFGNTSLYFPTEQEKDNAKNAFVWLYQKTFNNDSIHFNPEARNKCIASFSKEFSLSNNIAERLFSDFIRKSNAVSPVIIAIEGLDGSGKTVQAKKLSNVLEQSGKKVCVIDFPQYSSFFGKEIGALLSGTSTISAMELDEKSMCLWYALDRWKTVNSAQIDKYDYVIFNRYTLSSVVYQSARKYNGFNREFADWVFRLEHTQLTLPIPDIYIYLDMRTDFCGGNVLRKGERGYVDGLDVYERSKTLLSCCHNIYKRLSDEICEIRFLECIDNEGKFKSIEEINASIVACLTEYGLYI